MISFVLQNFYKNTPFLPKTRRYYTLVKNSNILLIYLLMKSLVLISTKLMYRSYIFMGKNMFDVYFSKRFWFIYKKYLYKSYGLYTNNLTKSLLLSFAIKSRDIIDLGINESNRTSLFSMLDSDTIMYSKPVPIVNFSLNSKVYKSYMHFVINTLVNFYPGFVNSFNINYTFLFLKDNFYIYNFINLFYFKVHNL